MQVTPEMQLDLFRAAALTRSPTWAPDPMSAEAYLANWELFLNGVTALAVRAPLFRGTIDPELRRFA
jgi:hypothetical protein